MGNSESQEMNEEQEVAMILAKEKYRIEAAAAWRSTVTSSFDEEQKSLLKGCLRKRQYVHQYGSIPSRILKRQTSLPSPALHKAFHNGQAAVPESAARNRIQPNTRMMRTEEPTGYLATQDLKNLAELIPGCYVEADSPILVIRKAQRYIYELRRELDRMREKQESERSPSTLPSVHELGLRLGRVSKTMMKHLCDLVKRSEDLSFPAATIQTLAEFSQQISAKTMVEFIQELERMTDGLKAEAKDSVSVVSGCELFMRFVTRMASDSAEDLSRFKRRLIENGSLFAEKSVKGREKIAEIALDFITDGCTILLHCHSRVVMTLLMNAARHNRRFNVLITEARPTRKGHEAAAVLNQAGIQASVILDAAVGYYMSQIDCVLVGAEGVVENGGIINQVGTFLISVMAKEANKPFYAVAESYKFVRVFPLSQTDLPSTSSCNLLLDEEGNSERELAGLKLGHPTIDYTPPKYITLLFTDIGVLTPSGVSDELIKLYF